MLRLLFILFFVVDSGALFAAPVNPQNLCKNVSKNYLASYTTQFPQAECRISIQDYRLGRRYLRFFSFNHEGRFNIFDSDSTIENNGKGTGIRVLYNLPRPIDTLAQLTINNSNSQFLVTLPNGEWIEFDGDTHTISKSSMPLISQSEIFGGVVFQKPSRGLLIDTQFHLGRESYAHPALPGESDVVNSKGKKCVVSNRLLFYKRGENYPLKTDEELRTIFANNCGSDFANF
jgi:hypothetical protein